MPLSISQIKVGAIVDWNVEWKDGKEYHRNPIRRGVIVRVEGDHAMDSIQAVYVAMGNDVPGKDKFEFNGVTIPCVKVAPRELCLRWDADSAPARKAWKDVFKIQEGVGFSFESRQQRQGKPKIVDALQLTGAPSQGPISDGPSSKKSKDDDDE